MTGCLAALLGLVAATAAAGQGGDLGRRVAGAPDGQVRFSYAARPGIYGNGRTIISWDCRNGRCRNQQVDGNYSDVDDEDRHTACDSGPVRIALTVRRGAVTGLRTYVGGEWRSGTGATDLGTVSSRDAASFLLSLATQGGGHVSREAIFPATLADSVTVWPDLLKIARNTSVPGETRRSAVFWLGQAAGAAATKGLSDLVDDDSMEIEVKKSAVFAMSQLPHDDGVPALIRVARSHKSPEVRKSALFWLGQTNDPRAIALFEEILTRP
jgi:hypothetical protein